MWRGEGVTQTQGVEGLWAQRVSERQTGWPFSTLHWQLVIRGNYKGLLATNHLILLWEREPNVIMAPWYADPAPSETKPRSQPKRSKLANFSSVQWPATKVFSFGQSERDSHLFPAAAASLFPRHWANLHDVGSCPCDTLCWAKSRSSVIILYFNRTFFASFLCHFRALPCHNSSYRDVFRTKPAHFQSIKLDSLAAVKQVSAELLLLSSTSVTINVLIYKVNQLQTVLTVLTFYRMENLESHFFLSFL